MNVADRFRSLHQERTDDARERYLALVRECAERVKKSPSTALAELLTDAELVSLGEWLKVIELSVEDFERDVATLPRWKNARQAERDRQADIAKRRPMLTIEAELEGHRQASLTAHGLLEARIVQLEKELKTRTDEPKAEQRAVLLENRIAVGFTDMMRASVQGES